MAIPWQQFGGELFTGESSADRFAAAQSQRVAINSVHHCYLVESRDAHNICLPAPRHSSEKDLVGGGKEEEEEEEEDYLPGVHPRSQFLCLLPRLLPLLSILLSLGGDRAVRHDIHNVFLQREMLLQWTK